MAKAKLHIPVTAAVWKKNEQNQRLWLFIMSEIQVRWLLSRALGAVPGAVPFARPVTKYEWVELKSYHKPAPELVEARTYIII